MRSAAILPVVALFLWVDLAPAQTKAGPKDPFRPPAIAIDGVPGVPATLWDRLRQYHSVRATAFSGWSPDGRGMLVATQFGNTTQLHRVYEPGGRREQITFFDEPVQGTFVPRSRDGAILLTMGKGGNENYQVYLLDRLTGKAALLTDGALRNQLQAIRPDGGQVILASTKRNGRDTDLYIGDPRRPDSLKMLLQTKGEFWTAADWSQDGGKVLLNRYVSINETYPALLDLATGERKMLTSPANGKVAYHDLAFLPDGQSAYVTTDARGEFQQLAQVNINTFAYEFISSDISWDVTSVTVEPSTGLTAFTVNEDGASALYLMKGKIRTRIAVPLGLISGLKFSPDGKHLGFTLARPDAPADAYSLAVAGGELTRWTYSEVGGLNPDPLRDAQAHQVRILRQTRDSGLLLQAGTGRGRQARSRHRHDSRRAGRPVPAKFQRPVPVLRQRARLCRRGPQRPRLVGLWQDLPDLGQCRQARG